MSDTCLCNIHTVSFSFFIESFYVPSPVLMKFVTRCQNVPPLALPPTFRVYFKDYCQPSENGTSCICLPKVSMCALFVMIPVQTQSQEVMIAAYDCKSNQRRTGIPIRLIFCVKRINLLVIPKGKLLVFGSIYLCYVIFWFLKVFLPELTVNRSRSYFFRENFG